MSLKRTANTVINEESKFGKLSIAALGVAGLLLLTGLGLSVDSNSDGKDGELLGQLSRDKEPDTVTANPHEGPLYYDFTPFTTSTTVRVHRAANRVSRPPNRVRSELAASSKDVWWRLAGCETGGTYDAVGYHYTGNGYYGFFQFDLSTWRSVGGTGFPTDFSYDVQRAFAERLQARSGWGRWPRCSKQLGLR